MRRRLLTVIVLGIVAILGGFAASQPASRAGRAAVR
ncbi:MAG: hypothetical protein UZ13_03876 [Chloroflexi bacterium OLB13]|nr:MAG: hypothetical protein UZ13_03876 [Chloroflexi bacterium OLB13]